MTDNQTSRFRKMLSRIDFNGLGNYKNFGRFPTICEMLDTKASI